MAYQRVARVVTTEVLLIFTLLTDVANLPQIDKPRWWRWEVMEVTTPVYCQLPNNLYNTRYITDLSVARRSVMGKNFVP
jgi:hypothetical protein